MAGIQKTGPIFEPIDPVALIADRLKIGGRCLFMPNGGNLGDCLIASATIQAFEKAQIPWAFIRGLRNTVQPSDVLVYGGGGSLVPFYEGGIQCVESLKQLGAPVVVLPQTIQGHRDFWSRIGEVTVFCRDAASLEYLAAFPKISALPGGDMALGLDLSIEPFSTVASIRSAMAAQNEHRVLHAFRGDSEASGCPPKNTFDLPALAHPAMADAASIHAHTAAFLATLAGYSEIHTDRLHVAIGASLLGIPVFLTDTIHGKNRGVFEASLKHRFPTLRFEHPTQNR
jgi:exopolysaccharide biosynthesis predicted pyruvyltransferase EpsI